MLNVHFTCLCCCLTAFCLHLKRCSFTFYINVRLYRSISLRKRGAGLFDIYTKECLCYFAHCFFCWRTNMSHNPQRSHSYMSFLCIRLIIGWFSSQPCLVTNKPPEFIFSLNKNLFLLLWRTRCVFSRSVCVHIAYMCGRTNLGSFLFACWCFFSACCCKCECHFTLKIRAPISSLHQLFWG